MEKTDSTNLDQNAVTNKALHIMAAHLHRYSSELERLENILRELQSWHDNLSSVTDANKRDEVDDDYLQAWRRVKLAYAQILSQLRATRAFGKELENKIDNILALVSAVPISSVAVDATGTERLLKAYRVWYSYSTKSKSPTTAPCKPFYEQRKMRLLNRTN